MMHFDHSSLNTLRHLMSVLLLATLVASCGGGHHQLDEKGNPPTGDLGQAASEISDDAKLSRSSELNTTTLLLAEKRAQSAEDLHSTTALEGVRPGQPVPKSAYTSGAVARKAEATSISAYRFYNIRTGAHFYTTSEAEVAYTFANLSPPFNYEGTAFSVASAYSPGLSPVHRFYNTRNGVHFYTISEAERAHVVANLPFYTYEGVAYHASQVSGSGLIPFHRFYVPGKGFHFYTASEQEKNNIIANLGATYRYEGVGYHVLDTTWRAEKLPHSGVLSGQCYEVGSDNLVSCTRSGALELNADQDGQRSNINSPVYRELPSPANGTYPLSSCVRDELTGLIWEGKNSSGERSVNNQYTSYGDGTTGDTSAYVSRVNQLALCGFTDWRLPTRLELLTIVDYGPYTGSSINSSAFPNTAGDGYWASESLSGDSARAWTVWFSQGTGWSTHDLKANAHAVRLVRGSATTGVRFTVSTIPYGSDAANNVVNDAWTGLQWRRCEEGRIWNGNACSGNASGMSHEAAMLHSRQRANWRLPNIKELSSLVVLTATSGARIDATAFPGAAAANLWSSSPYTTSSDYSWIVNFSNGAVDGYPRMNATGIRLVRKNP
jgi:Protein of unknown function (DUF1566)/Repeat of unknown function (DUF5648)